MTQKIYALDESAIIFADSGGQATLSCSALAAGAGRVSARYDRGTSAKPIRGRVRAVFQMATAGVVGESIDIYIASSDGTPIDGEVGTSDAALSSTNKLNNLLYVGSVIVDTTATDTNITATFDNVLVSSRYLTVVVHNNTADDLRTSTSVHSVTFTPYADQLQNAAA